MMSEETAFNISDLKEMDIVLRRDGRVCWVLKNEYSGLLQTFLPDMWGQHEIKDYDEKFRYKGDLILSRRERQPNIRYDIVAVSKSRSPWKSIYNMREYEKSLKSNDQEDKDRVWEEFNWIKVGG